MKIDQTKSRALLIPTEHFVRSLAPTLKTFLRWNDLVANLCNNGSRYVYYSFWDGIYLHAIHVLREVNRASISVHRIDSTRFIWFKTEFTLRKHDLTDYYLSCGDLNGLKILFTIINRLYTRQTINNCKKQYSKSIVILIELWGTGDDYFTLRTLILQIFILNIVDINDIAEVEKIKLW